MQHAAEAKDLVPPHLSLHIHLLLLHLKESMVKVGRPNLGCKAAPLLKVPNFSWFNTENPLVGKKLKS